MANASIATFKRVMTAVSQSAHDAAVGELNDRAAELAQRIEDAAPVHEGVLKTTVKVVPGKKDTIVRVVAGGYKTVRPSVSSKPYDYARADEFGTVNMPAHPFFFPTYHAFKKGMQAAVKDKTRKAVEKYSAK